MKDSLLSLWNSTFAKILRWIMFVPMYFISIWLILVLYLLSLDATFWLLYSDVGILIEEIFGYSLGGITLMSIFLLPVYSSYAVKICPNAKIGAYIFMLTTIITLSYYIYYLISNIWNYGNDVVIFSIIIALISHAALFWGALAVKKESK